MMEKFSGTKKMVLLANLTAVAIVLGLVENIYQISVVPGAKLGLANLITIFVLYVFSWKEAYTVSIVRVVMVGVLTGFPQPVFFMGFGGALLSVGVMSSLKLFKFGITLTSLVGSISHQVGQILVAILAFNTVEITAYLTIMIPLGVITGLVIGIISERFIIHFNKINNDD